MNTAQLQLFVDAQNKRWFQILNILDRHHCSQKKLAHSLGVSTRTILSDINNIKDHFRESISIVASTNSSGLSYTLTVDDKLLYINIKRELLENEPILTILSAIFYEDILTLQDWSERLFIGERTLVLYLKALDPLLEQYQLKLNYPILSIEGKEIDIRNFFFSIFYLEDTIPHYVFPPVIIKTVIEKLSETEFNLLLTKTPHYKVSYILFITYQRIKHGHKLILDDYLVEMMVKLPLFDTMNLVAYSIEKYTTIQLNTSDLSYLMLSMLDSDSYHQVELAPIFKEAEANSFKQLAIDLAKELNIIDNYKTDRIFQFFFQLNFLKAEASASCLFISPSLLQHNNVHYEKELIQLNRFLKRHSNTFPMKDSANFAHTLLLFTVRMEYELFLNRYNIAFLFEGSNEVILVLKNVLLDQLPDKHSLYFLNSYTSLGEVLATHSIDLVVTNFSEYIFELPEEVDRLLFSYIPTPEDWNSLFKYLDPRVHNRFTSLIDLDDLDNM